MRSSRTVGLLASWTVAIAACTNDFGVFEQATVGESESGGDPTDGTVADSEGRGSSARDALVDRIDDQTEDFTLDVSVADSMHDAKSESAPDAALASDATELDVASVDAREDGLAASDDASDEDVSTSHDAGGDAISTGGGGDAALSADSKADAPADSPSDSPHDAKPDAVACGAVGEACCAANACAGACCDTVRGQCIAAACTECGGNGQVCCPTAVQRCGANLTCRTGRCR
jgi:hypothetical protein